MRIQPLLLSALVALAWWPDAARAQNTDALRETVQRTLQGNPEVSARWNAYRAASEGLEAARGARGPRLDLSADAGRDEGRFDGSVRTHVNRAGMGLELRQVLWDGRGAEYEVTRSGHERQGRWFELLDIVEQSSLEAVRAVLDVQRFRRLVALAEENLAQHRSALARIESRVRAGVARGVDQEQAQARLALAESNLASEKANLHDVTARHLRIVGQAPARSGWVPVVLQAGLPDSPAAALQASLAQHPQITAAIESLRAARAAVRTREAVTQPRLEVLARAGGGHNLNGVVGQRADASVGLAMNWNLWDNGVAGARVREQQALLAQATDLRDKACRDVRQTLAIAYNDWARLSEQRRLLKLNTEAIDRARLAYRQQFEIGQRSVLDMLNAENEAYTASRALANAEYDQALAAARTHAAMGRLTEALGIRREHVPADTRGWQPPPDEAERCPASVLSAGLQP